MDTMKKIIEAELNQMEIKKGSLAYKLIYKGALAASEILTKKEMVNLIKVLTEDINLEDSLQDYPH